MFASKIYNNNQIVIPSEIRKKHDLKPGNIVEWFEDENGEIIVRFRKKSQLRDIVGILNTKKSTNAVKLKKMDKNEIRINRNKQK